MSIIPIFRRFMSMTLFSAAGMLSVLICFGNSAAAQGQTPENVVGIETQNPVDTNFDHFNRSNFVLEHNDTFRPADGVVGIYSPDNALLKESITQTGIRYQIKDELADGLDPGQTKVLVLNASPANLDQLLALRDQAEAFQEAGGWIMLNGLTPEGIIHPPAS